MVDTRDIYFYGRYKQNFKGYFHVIRVLEFSGMNIENDGCPPSWIFVTRIDVQHAGCTIRIMYYLLLAENLTVILIEMFGSH